MQKPSRRKKVQETQEDGTGPFRSGPVHRRRFGEELRAVRRERKLSQQALADRSELAVDTVRRVESGTFSPSLETLARLAHGLEISLGTLFDRIDGRHQNGVAAELWDYLTARSEDELRVARRILVALFDRDGD